MLYDVTLDFQVSSFNKENILNLTVQHSLAMLEEE